MKDYQETKRNYNAGINWHIQKSLSYNWNNQINRFVNGLQGKRVLDVGCGGGRDITEFLKRGLQVDGLDYSGKTIEDAESNFQKQIFMKGI